MGNGISAARYLTLGSYAINFSTQIYGMVTSPNMKEVADGNHFAWSPNPWFIAAFFSGQTIVQAYWIWQVWNVKPQGYERIDSTKALNGGLEDVNRQAADDQATSVAVRYAPVYALGNLCIAGWLFFWLRESFNASQILVTVNSAIQLLAVLALPPLTPSSPRLLWTTHIVAKTFAGIGILDFLDNGGVATHYRAPPSNFFQAVTYIGIPTIAVFSGPIFGSTLVYDLAAIYFGQRDVIGAGSWASKLGWSAIATGGIVFAKGLMGLRQ